MRELFSSNGECWAKSMYALSNVTTMVIFDSWWEKSKYKLDSIKNRGSKTTNEFRKIKMNGFIVTLEFLHINEIQDNICFDR